MINGQCWCLHNNGTAGYSVCGYPSEYSGTYYSIASDLDPSPWTIIKGLGRSPHSSRCTKDTKMGCQSNCANNLCMECNSNSICTECYGSWSEKRCWSNEQSWNVVRIVGGIVRCTNMEGK